jgi:cytochrome c553
VAGITALVVLALSGTLIRSRLVQADNNDDHRDRDDRRDSDEARIRRGFEIAPVPLDLRGKNRDLVGLGSYLVNVVASCNDCHSAGAQTQYAAGGNPFFGQQAKTNPATYLGGGNDFGPLIPGTPDIVSRNLTPDKTGLPEGGHTFPEFLKIIRTGVDMDHLHPPCSATVTTDCLPPPFNGDLLQIMPWPNFKSLSDRDVRAIYEYLRAVPCVEGPPAPSPLHNECQ